MCVWSFLVLMVFGVCVCVFVCVCACVCVYVCVYINALQHFNMYHTYIPFMYMHKETLAGILHHIHTVKETTFFMKQKLDHYSQFTDGVFTWIH